ncbi:MAG: hypothetical protein N3F66_11680 [Spirochaetes bacterium]|nr:hypothetical protein [Spirochaetota bacterium]
MEKERLMLLRSSIEAQIAVIDKIYSKIDERKKKKGKWVVENIGYQLHNLYCAFEDLFKIIAREFENNIDNASKYHYELLRRMSISIEGIRPKLISEETLMLLDNLRSFRHFFRHAYSYELDKRKINIVLEDALKLQKIYKNDITAFLNVLENKQ